jgi:hypothetical protein
MTQTPMSDAELHFVCTLCGQRQATAEACTKCGDDSPLDLRKQETRNFLHDLERRFRDKRNDRIRWIGVVTGMLVIFACWMIPGWWAVRSKTFALPMLLDQWIYVGVIAWGTITVLERTYGTKRLYPWLPEDS